MSRKAETYCDVQTKFEVDPKVNSKVSIFQGDITKLEVDAIVNAANEKLLGGGGVDGAIHRAAGKELLEECQRLNGCRPGDAKITKGYKLPARHVIHTVGPRGEKPDVLSNCYRTSFDHMISNGLRSIAFPCISTGIFGYPRVNAAHVALRRSREFLDHHAEDVDRIIFCVFLNEDLDVYEDLMRSYFPIS